MIPRFAVCIVLLSLGTILVDAQGRAAQEKHREQWQRVADIFVAMGVQSGATVADVGAGDGFFTSRLAGAVGASGHVYAVDVADTSLDRLRRRITDEAHTNVTVIKGTPIDPQLPPASLDAALIVNAYHEMTEHQAMLHAIRSALKPSGRLVIIEPISDSRRSGARPDQTRNHQIAPDYVLQDVRSAGFRVIGLQDPFTIRGRDTEWMLTVTPGTTTAAVVLNPAAPPKPDPAADAWRDPALRISIDEFVKLAESAGATIIDVRDTDMFAKGHLPNAVLIPSDDIESSVDRLRALKRPFVTYCS